MADKQGFVKRGNVNSATGYDLRVTEDVKGFFNFESQLTENSRSSKNKVKSNF